MLEGLHRDVVDDEVVPTGDTHTCMQLWPFVRGFAVVILQQVGNDKV